MLAIDVSTMYWETYDDQSSEDFDYVGYINISGEHIVEEVASNLTMQVAEIRRTNGQHTEVRVYRGN